MSIEAFDMIVARLGALEAQEAFEARRRRITRGDVFGLPFTIKHYHDNDDLYWDGGYTRDASLFHVQLDIDWSTARATMARWHYQHTDILSTQYVELLTNEHANFNTTDMRTMTSADAGFPNSIYRFLYHHVIYTHLKKAIDGEELTLLMTEHCDGLHLLVKSTKYVAYVDDILHSLCNALRRPEVFGASFNVQSASIGKALSGHELMFNAIDMCVTLSEFGKTELWKAMENCNEGVVARYFGASRFYGGGSDEGFNDAEKHKLNAFMRRMDKLDRIMRENKD